MILYAVRWRCVLSVPLMSIGVLVFSSLWLSLAGVSVAAESRTWKTLAELSAEERAGLDLSPETPRHPQFPYLPAEPYPFTPSYTAPQLFELEGYGKVKVVYFRHPDGTILELLQQGVRKRAVSANAQKLPVK